MTKEDIYYFCTTCKHIHLRNSEIGKLHIGDSFKTKKDKKEMDLAAKGMGAIDFGLEKRISEKKKRKIMKRIK